MNEERPTTGARTVTAPSVVPRQVTRPTEVRPLTPVQATVRAAGLVVDRLQLARRLRPLAALSWGFLVGWGFWQLLILIPGAGVYLSGFPTWQLAIPIGIFTILGIGVGILLFPVPARRRPRVVEPDAPEADPEDRPFHAPEGPV